MKLTEKSQFIWRQKRRGKIMLYEIAKQFQGEPTGYHPYPSITDRAAWENLDAEWKEETIRLGEKYLGFAWPYMSATDFWEFARNGNRIRYEDRFFAKRHALNALVLAECVENKGRFLDDIINGIFSICDESAWNLPAHNWYQAGTFPLPDLTEPTIDLFACETGAVMATVIYLLQPVLDKETPLIVKRVYRELEWRVYTPYLERHYNWMGSDVPKEGVVINNWTPWCTQNILLSAFLVGDGMGRRKEILEKACKSADIFLATYGEDGCCDEGAQYYRAAGLCLGAVLRICNTVTGGAFEKLYEEPLIRNMAAYIYRVHVDDIYYVNFADCSPVAGRAGIREFVFAKETKNPDMMKFAAEDFTKGKPDTLVIPKENNLFYRLANAFHITEVKEYMEKINAEEKEGRQAADSADIDVFYPSTGMMVVRDGKLLLAAKGGDNDDSHNHNDVGSFTIYKDGKPLFIDVGVETYSKKTFSEQRYEIWTMQSSYHNLPEINGYMQLPGKEYRAEDVVCDLKNGVLDMELAKAYPEECGIGSYHRTAQLIKGQEIQIEDSFAWKDGADNSVVISLMTYERPVVGETDAQGVQHIAIGGGEGLPGASGTLLLENAKVSAVETIPIDDARLQITWKHEVYRILVKPERENVIMKIC